MTYLILRPSCLAQTPIVFFCDCSAEEISKIISELENGKSSDIPAKIIKKSNKFISPILAQHFNYLIKIGKFPDDLKTGRITPFYKKDNVELLENYRPISTLPIFGKLFEKIYIVDFIDSLCHKIHFMKNNLV